MSYLFFSDTYVPRCDGVAHSVAWTVDAMRNLGEDVILVRPQWCRNDKGNSDEIILPSIRPWLRDYRVSPYGYTASVSEWLVNSGLASRDISLVHVHSLGPLGMLGFRYAWSMAIPVVLTWHTDVVAYSRYYGDIYLAFLAALPAIYKYLKLRPVSLREAIDAILRSVDAVIAPSVKSARQLNSISQKSVISVIPTGLPAYVSEHQYLPKRLIRRSLGVDDDQRLVLSVGRLSGEKNPRLLGSILDILCDANPQVRCIIVGDSGVGNRRVRNMLNYVGSVKVLPPIGHSDLLNLYSAADVLIVPSVTETQGLTVLEAASVGLPVVCIDKDITFFGYTKIPGVRVSASTDPNDVATAIVGVLDNPSSTSAASVRNVMDTKIFSSETQALRLLELYHRIIFTKSRVRVPG
jgi:1,2-diacylglycerol 3-alpha-glucosyltransferase